ncbi:MAG: hypothetical protein WDN72_10835 [Alphaproteobacteria bacterium]
MQLIRHPGRFAADSPSAVAIGNFDGLHLGHRAILARTCALAGEHGLTPTVLTFEPHPRRLFAPAAPHFRLEPLNVKLRRLAEAGIARIVLPRFDAAIRGDEPRAVPRRGDGETVARRRRRHRGEFRFRQGPRREYRIAARPGVRRRASSSMRCRRWRWRTARSASSSAVRQAVAEGGHATRRAAARPCI